MRTPPVLRQMLFGLTALGVAACGPLRLAEVDPYVPQSYSMNGVKLLGPEFARGDDPATFGRDSYTLTSSRRLLLRFESLSEKVTEVVLSDGKVVEVDVGFASEEDATSALGHLRLCPITRNWMMLATWENAHPFSPEGRWSSAGGDIDLSGCVGAAKAEGQLLTFDMSTWFVDYPRGRGQNYGLALLTDSPVTILGDTSGSLSPRIRWTSKGIR